MQPLAHTLEILERTPGVVAALLGGLGDAWTGRNYGPGTWSAYEVVGHLIMGEWTDWMARLRRIMEHGESKAFDPFPHDSTIGPEAGGPLDGLITTFASLRAENLRALRAMGLSPADLERHGLHTALGRVTAGQLLATWAAHDLHHLRQMALAMAWQSRDEVGPWRAYLNTLAPR